MSRAVHKINLYHCCRRSRIVIAARMKGLDAVDGPVADFRNPEKYRDDARRAAVLGLGDPSVADRTGRGGILT